MTAITSAPFRSRLLQCQWLRHTLAPCLVACLSLASPAAFSQAADFAQVKQAFDQQRYEPAREGFQQLAEAGDPRAMFYLGVIHNQGLGAAVDLQQAFGWYEKSAKLGHAVAQYNLGNAFKHGRGTAKSEELAVFWWEKAAQQGQTNAQYNVALQYYLGLGVDKNMDKALHYFHEAADRGHPKAVALIAEGKVPARKPAPGPQPAAALAVNSQPASSPSPIQSRSAATAVAPAPGNEVAAMAAQRQAPPPPASAPQQPPAAVAPAKPAAVPSALDWAPVRQDENAGSIPASSSASAPPPLPAPERGKSILPAPGSKLSLSDWTPVRMDKPVDTFGVGSTFGGGGGVQGGGVPSVPSAARTWGQGASAPSVTALPVPQADITVTNSSAAQAAPAAVAQNPQPPAAPFRIVDSSAGLPSTAVAPSPVRPAPQPIASTAPMSAPPAGTADQDRARLTAPAARPPQGTGQSAVVQTAEAQSKGGVSSPARGPATSPKAARLPPIEQTPELAPPPAPPALVAPAKKAADSPPATAKPRQMALASGKPAPVQPPPQAKPSAQVPSAAPPLQRPVASAAPASAGAAESRQRPQVNATPATAQPPQSAQASAVAIAPRQPSAPVQTGTSSPADPSGVSVLNRTWLLAQKPSDCTIQLAVMSNTASLESFLDSYSLRGRVKVLEVVAAQQKRYHVLLGNYPDLASAETRIHSLDTSLQLLKPWARCYAALAAIPAQ